MADLTITASSVLPGSNSVQETVIWGGTIVQGKVVYLDSTVNKWKVADNNSATVAERSAKGIALTAGSDGQPGIVHKEGDLTIGATMTAGVAYYLSDTPGGICPVADLIAGEYVCLLGLAKSTTVLDVRFQFSGVSL